MERVVGPCHVHPVTCQYTLGVCVARPHVGTHVEIFIHGGDVIKRCVYLWGAAQLQYVALTDLCYQEVDHCRSGPEGSFEKIPVLAVFVPQLVVLSHAALVPCVLDTQAGHRTAV